MIETVKESPSDIDKKWKDTPGVENFVITDAFILLHEYVKDTSLKIFQYKILYRILPTNKLLYKMKIINYNCCYICRTHVETLEHMFFNCTEIKNLWFKIFDELKLKDKFENIKCDLQTILFGYKCNNNDFISGINIFILLVKLYIFNCKNNENTISFIAAKCFLKYRCGIQKSISKNVNREWAFIDDWM